MKPVTRHLLRALALCALCALALQAYFVLRIATMAVLDPQSTSFQRSELWRLVTTEGSPPWRQAWVGYDQIAPNLKRAVIAAEDAGFVEHSGVEWDAIERAWERNQRAEAMAARLADTPRAEPAREPRVVGGSTITQQLAKNLFLSGERHISRKAQEFVIALALEALLDKRRILEIYLNSVEWGEGVFGAEAAAEKHFKVTARSLSPMQAARLAVMLPAPKRFERRLGSAYLNGRAGAISARMRDVELP